MFDATYFKKTLQRDVDAVDAAPVVEVVLLSGHAYRVRAVADVSDGHVALECYQVKGDLAPERLPFGGETSVHTEIFRVMVSYESIAAVVLDPSEAHAKVRPGFA